MLLLCLLTTVQFDMETLLRLSSSRRWYWNHWLIHKYKCTFSELLSYLLCCFPIKAKNYIHFAFHILVTRYKNYDLQKAVLNELVSLSWLDNKCFNVSSSKCYKVVFVYLGPSEFSTVSGKICAVIVQMTLKYTQLYGLVDSRLQRCLATNQNGCGSGPG